MSFETLRTPYPREQWVPIIGRTPARQHPATNAAGIITAILGRISRGTRAGVSSQQLSIGGLVDDTTQQHRAKHTDAEQSAGTDAVEDTF